MHHTHLVTFVTGFGDQAVILPFVVTVAIALAAAGARREAFYWCVAIFAALLGSLVAKLFFIPCGHLFPGLDIRSPSGHTTATIAAYGGFAVLWAKLARDRRMTALFIGTAVVGCVAIALSRVLLGAHTVPEVLLGAAIGLVAPAILYRAEPPSTEPRPRPTLFLLLVPLALTFLLHGATLPVEDQIASFALKLMSSLGLCA